MSAIQQIFRNIGPAYLARYESRMPAVHKKVMRAVMECRTGAFGTAQYGCEKCGSTHDLDCCCGNRHCPTCQIDKANQWLESQVSKLLPCNYFLLTLTLPDELRHVARSNQRVTYAAMFSCAYDALKKLAKDKRFIGSPHIGMLGALHTWGGQLQYHPHLHLIVPGGALDKDGQSWLSSRKDLFVHTKPLARIFRAKFRDAMKNAGLLESIDPCAWKQEWVIDSQAVGNGQTTLRYLARYVFRGPMSRRPILGIQDARYVIQYWDRDSMPSCPCHLCCPIRLPLSSAAPIFPPTTGRKRRQIPAGDVDVGSRRQTEHVFDRLDAVMCTRRGRGPVIPTPSSRSKPMDFSLIVKNRSGMTSMARN